MAIFQFAVCMFTRPGRAFWGSHQPGESQQKFHSLPVDRTRIDQGQPQRLNVRVDSLDTLEDASTALFPLSPYGKGLRGLAFFAPKKGFALLKIRKRL